MNPAGLAPVRHEPAIQALGWDGRTLDGLRLLDAEVTVSASGPDLRGILIPVGVSWRRTLSVARACLPLAPTALLFDAAEPPSELCLLECGYAEVGIVVETAVLLPARPPRPAGRQRRSVDRALAQQLDSQLAAR